MIFKNWGWWSGLIYQLLFICYTFQVNKTYSMSESGSSVPSYISSLPSPLRRRHKDDLLAADSTVVCSARRYDCAPPGRVLQCLGGGYCCCQHLLWQGHCHGWEDVCTPFLWMLFPKNWSEASGWDQWSSLPPLEGSLASALGSASSPSSRLSTGQSLAFTGMFSTSDRSSIKQFFSALQ